MDLESLTIRTIHNSLLQKKFSASELVEEYLRRAQEENKKINGFITIAREEALRQAKTIDDLIESRQDLPLVAGVPFGLKDNILAKDLRCTGGSKILSNYIAPYDATVTKKLKNNGGVLIGKANMDEFAVGSSGEYSAFGPTRNPYNLEYVPGGSSSGPAAIVSDSLVTYSLGSDTGGSVRLPASFCGVVGFKPSYGMVSRFGLMAMSSSLDQIGPLAKTVEDAQIIFDIIRGRDVKDATTVETDGKESKNIDFSHLRIGLPREYFNGVDEKIDKRIRDVVKKAEKSGAVVKEISLPHTEYALATYYVIMTAELSSNLSRYDGIKYGYSDNNANDILNVYLQSREKGFGDEVRRRIVLGTYVLSAGYYDAYYLRAQKIRTLIMRDFDQAFKDIDIIITPSSPTLPFKIGERMRDPLTMYLSDILTVPVNLAGLPGISIPCGLIDGLPTSFQLIGQRFKDDTLLYISKQFEQLIR